MWQDHLELQVHVGVTGVLASDPWHWEPTTLTDSRWDTAKWSRVTPYNPSDAEAGDFTYYTVPCGVLEAVSWSSGCQPWAWNSSARTFEVAIWDPAGEWHPAGRVGGGLGIRPGSPVRIEVKGAGVAQDDTWSGLDLSDTTLGTTLAANGQLRAVRTSHTPSGERLTIWQVVDMAGVYGRVDPEAQGSTPVLNVMGAAQRVIDVAAAAGLPRYTDRRLWWTAVEPMISQTTDVAQAAWGELARLVNSAARRLLTWPVSPGPVAAMAWRPNWDDDDGTALYYTPTPGFDDLELLDTVAGFTAPTLRPWVTNTTTGPLVICPSQLRLESTVDYLANRVELAEVGGSATTYDDLDSQQVYGVRRWARSDLLIEPEVESAALTATPGATVAAWRSEAVWSLDTLEVPIVTAADYRRLGYLMPGGYARAPSHEFFGGAAPCVLPILWDDPDGFTWRAPATVAGIAHRVTPSGWRCSLEVELGILETWDDVVEEWTAFRP